MGMRSSVCIWVGFSGPELIQKVVDQVGSDPDLEPYEWEPPADDTTWAAAYGYDDDDDDDGEEVLVGFGIELLEECPQAAGKHAAKIDLEGLSKRVPSATAVLVAYLRDHGVSEALLDEIDLWIRPDFG